MYVWRPYVCVTIFFWFCLVFFCAIYLVPPDRNTLSPRRPLDNDYDTFVTRRSFWAKGARLYVLPL